MRVHRLLRATAIAVSIACALFFAPFQAFGAPNVNATTNPNVTSSFTDQARLAMAQPEKHGKKPPPQDANITTHHSDTLRSGWNANETELSPATVSSSFGLLRSIPLDEQVDAQPLFVSDETIGRHKHDVVYVATENDTLYALDASKGATLWQRNFGAAVPQSALPGGCGNNSALIGINSTPVIDLSTNTMYLTVDTFENNFPIYRVHAVDLSSGNDKLTPRVVTASHLLSDGTTYNFSARESRARAALLEANGVIYTAFGSYCDIEANLSRGWLLGWSANSLAPLPANELNDRLATSPDSFFLSSIWMSGNGPAADAQGNLYYVTGNSDYSGTTYGAYNISESVVKHSADLSTVLSLFTPSNVAGLDQSDADYGSGGVMLLPDQAGSIPHMAVAAGKDGRLFLLNRDALGGYTPGGPDKIVGVYGVGGCWCGQAYFMGADGVGRVVSSGGSQVRVWKIQTSPAALVNESTSATLASGQDGGFFTSVSSNGTRPGTALIWAVGRPLNNNPATITLYAINAANGATLFGGAAGTWPNTGGNANIVPVAANGRVYVASYKNLSIFGLH